MNQTELVLWQKLESFQFDKPNINLTFAKRLARENNFSESFSKQIIEEYKKFIFLCCLSNQQITPSHYVDLVWHLHLTYTKSYWIDLCQNTIQREIHHNPTEGGNAETNKFKSFYNQTLELYKEKFNVIPPENIWQNDVERFKIRIENIDRNQNWIIPKPKFFNFKTNFSLIIIFSFTLYGCSENSLIAIPIIFIAFILGIIIYSTKMNSENDKEKEKNNQDFIASGCGTGSLDYSSKSNDDSSSDTCDSDAGGDSGGGDSGCSGCGGCGGCGS